MSTQKNEHNPEPELKPCPFCGKSNKVRARRDAIAYVTSQWIVDCECGGTGPNQKNELSAIDAWNRRITPPTDTTGSGREGETPETDAEMRRIEADEHEYEDRHDCYVALLKFARQLERQRDAALAEIARLRGEITAHLDDNPDAVRVREGGGEEDITASLAVTIEKMQSKAAQVDGERLAWLEKNPDRVKYIHPHWYSGRYDSASLNPDGWSSDGQWPTLRAAIDSAQRQEGR